jgi:plastocyanin
VRFRFPGELTWLAGLLAGLGLAGCFSERALSVPSGGSCATTFEPGAIVLSIKTFSFQPNTVHVRVGGKLTWVNCEDTGIPSHTTTADGGAWSSPLLSPGLTYTVTFPTAGTYTYHCEPHPFMTGQVIVDP